MHTRSRLSALAVTALVATVSLGSAPPSAASSSATGAPVATATVTTGRPRPPIVHPMPTRPRRGTPSDGRSTGDLVDHGGPVLPVAHAYVLWWGPASAWAPDVRPGVRRFFAGLRGSRFLATATQYLRGAALDFRAALTRRDSAVPTTTITPAVLAAEVARTFGSRVDPHGVYFVYTSTFPRGARYCAWHSAATVGTATIAVAYMPNITGVAGCDPQLISGRSRHATGSALRALVNVTSHELMEALTDPQPGRGTVAWVDAHGQEIGDKCAWAFGSPTTLTNKSTWALQSEWSNADSGCVSPT